MESKKEINNNGFDYIDLDLPSGTLWATCNVGASRSSDYGLYFQWGDTQGYDFSQIGKDKQFNWNDYKWSIDGSDTNFSKYTTKNATLNLEDDAANFHMGGAWHMPSCDQIKELIENTTSTRTILDDVSGRLFVSKKDTSKSIFIPAAGLAWDGGAYISGNTGNVWSSMTNPYKASYGLYLHFNLVYVHLCIDNRCYGRSVRGVIG